MSTKYERLTDEIRKIITSPYPVCLKSFHDILVDCGDQRPQVLQQWACETPEAVPKLAKEILDNPSKAVYVLDTIGLLSDLIMWRDAFIELSPVVLSEFLQKALNSSDSPSRYTDICLKLLTNPLPPTSALPHLAEGFLWTFVEKAVESPSVELIEPIYTLLDGACYELVDTLSLSDVEKIQGHVIKVMRNATSSDEQLLNLLCLAVIAKTIPKHGRSSAHKLFVGERSTKTLQLLALQVIYMCRTDAAVSNQLRIKHVRLARKIINAVDVEIRRNWTLVNLAIIKKLLRKVSTAGLDCVLQIEALAFYSQLAFCEDSSTATMAVNFTSTLLTIFETKNFDRHTNQALAITLPIFGPSVSADSWKEIILAASKASNDRSCQVYGDSVLMYIGQLERHWNSSLDTRSRVAEAISGTEDAEKLEQILIHYTSEGSISACLLSTALVNATLLHAAEKAEMDVTLASKLVKTFQPLGKAKAKLPSGSTCTQVPKELQNQTNVPQYDNIHSQNWRERLLQELNDESKRVRADIPQLICQICYDFETRCNDIEQPLQKEMQKVSNLKHENESLRQLIQDLQDQGELQRRDIKATKAVSSVRNEEAALKLNELNRKCADLEAHLKCKQFEHETTISNMRNDFELEKLRLEARIACEVEKSDDLCKVISSLREKLHETGFGSENKENHSPEHLPL